MPPPPRRAAGQAYALFALTLLLVLVGVTCPVSSDQLLLENGALGVLS